MAGERERPNNTHTKPTPFPPPPPPSLRSVSFLCSLLQAPEGERRVLG